MKRNILYRKIFNFIWHFLAFLSNKEQTHGKTFKLYSKIQIILSGILFIACFSLTGITAIKTYQKDSKAIKAMKVKSAEYITPAGKKEIKTKIILKQIDTASSVLKELTLHTPTIASVLTKNATLFNSYAATMGITFFIIKDFKMLIKSKRPDGTNEESFPSGHASLSALGATFFGLHFGHVFAIPLYLASIFSGCARVIVQKHNTIDVMCGWFLGIYCAIYSTRVARNILSYILKKVGNKIKPKDL